MSTQPNSTASASTQPLPTSLTALFADLAINEADSFANLLIPENIASPFNFGASKILIDWKVNEADKDKLSLEYYEAYFGENSPCNFVSACPLLELWEIPKITVMSQDGQLSLQDGALRRHKLNSVFLKFQMKWWKDKRIAENKKRRTPSRPTRALNVTHFSPYARRLAAVQQGAAPLQITPTANTTSPAAPVNTTSPATPATSTVAPPSVSTSSTPTSSAALLLAASPQITVPANTTFPATPATFTVAPPSVSTSSTPSSSVVNDPLSEILRKFGSVTNGITNAVGSESDDAMQTE